MADVHNIKTRSYNMSQIKSKDTKPELLVRNFLHTNGFRYRLHDKTISGKPDIVFRKLKTVIFVHGCFWHGHDNCKYFVLPKTRTKWWKEKIESNKERDLKNSTILKAEGWNVLSIFECQLKKDKLDRTLNIFLNRLNKISVAKYE